MSRTCCASACGRGCAGPSCHSRAAVLKAQCQLIAKQMSPLRDPPLPRSRGGSDYRNPSRLLLRAGPNRHRHLTPQTALLIAASRIFVIFGPTSHVQACPQYGCHRDQTVDRSPRSARTPLSEETSSPSLPEEGTGASSEHIAAQKDFQGTGVPWGSVAALFGADEGNWMCGGVLTAREACVMALGKIEAMAEVGNFCGLRIDYRIFVCDYFRREDGVRGSEA